MKCTRNFDGRNMCNLSLPVVQCTVECYRKNFLRRSARLVLLLSCFLFSPAVHSASAPTWEANKKLAQYVLATWQDEHGLPQNAVQALAQTPDGYIWAGLEEGLVRFDGVRFQLFNETNTPAIQHDNITALLVDHAGRLWIGTRGGGLNCYFKGAFTHYGKSDGLAHEVVSALLEDAQHNLWIGTNGGGLSRWRDGAFTTYSTREGLASNLITALALDEKNNLWIGTENNGLSIWENDTFANYNEQHGLPSANLAALQRDAHGVMWLGTDAGLVRAESGKFSTYTTRDGLVHDFVKALTLDRSGNLWIGTNGGGVNRLVRGEFDLLTSAMGLSNDFIRAFYEDHEGSMWIGTYGGGLNLVYESRFTPIAQTSGLDNEMVWSILEDQKGTVWIGTDKGVYQYANGKARAALAELGQEVIRALQQTRDGALWLGTDNRGLYRWHRGALRHFTTAEGLVHNSVRAVYEDRHGNLWVGTNQGLNILRPGSAQKFELIPELAHDRVPAIFEDRAGRIWLGTGQSGMFCYAEERFTEYTTADGLSSNFVRTFYEDENGALWIGTRGGGLNRLKDGKFTHYSVKQGLFDDVVFHILPDAEGRLWMTCNKGVFHVSLAQLNEFAEGKRDAITCSSYGRADGMKSHECNGGSQPAGWRARNGRLYFPTIRGVAMIDPAQIKFNTIPPRVEIVEVRAQKQALPHAPHMELAPGSNDLEIHYTGLSFVAPERMKFRYKLEGYDTEWIAAGTRRVAFYTSLPPGDYTFRVAACNNDGVWSEASASGTLALKLKPYFYQTTWFYLLGIAALVFSGVGAMRFRQRHIIARAQELALLVEERTQDLQQEIEVRKRTEAELRNARDELELRVLERTAALQESERRWHFALEGNGDGVWDWNAQTNKVFFSKRWKEMLGYAEHEVGDDLEEWSSRVHPEDWEPTVALVQQHLRGETPIYISEHRVRCKDGSYKWILDRGRVLTRTPEGAALRVVGTHSDITARKQTIAALQESQAKLHTVMEHVPDAIVIISRGKVIYSNSALVKKLGCDSVAEMVGQSPLAFMHPEDHARATADVEALLQTGGERAAQYRLISKNGALIDIEAYSRLIEYDGARVLLGVLRDITERNLTGRALVQQKELLQSILNHMTSGLIVADTTGKILIINPAAKAIVGLRPEDLLPQAWPAHYGCYWPDKITPFTAEQLPLVRTLRGEEVEATEMFLRNEARPEGRWLNITGRPLRDAQGNVTSGLVVFNDITARKQMEAALRESEERFRQFAESIQEVFWMTDPAKNQMLYVSPAYEKVSGRTVASLYANPREWLDAIHEEDRERVLHAALTQQTLGVYDETYRIIHLDGTQRWLRDRAFPVRNAAGEVYRIAGIAEDITAQKLAQEKIAELKNFYETILDQLPMQIALFDHENRYLYINPAAVKDPEMRQWLIGKTSVDYCRARNVPEAIGQARMEMVQRSLTTQTTVSFEEEFPSKDASLRHILRFCSPLIDTEGGHARVLSYSVDITERKRAELAVRESEARFHAIVEATPIPMIITRMQDGLIRFANQQALDTFGLTQAEALGHYTMEFYANPEERQRVLRALQSQDYVSNYELQMRRNDGGTFWVVLAAQKLLLENEPAVIVGFYEVTARKEAEDEVRRLNAELEQRVRLRTQELQESEERLRQIAENIDEVLWIESREPYGLLYVSPNYEKVWGRSRESLFAHPETFMDSVFDEDRERFKAHLQKQRRGEYSEIEYRIVRPEGDERWVWDRSFPIHDSAGQIYRTAGMAEDITLRKHEEEAEKQRTARVIRHQTALLQLAQTDNTDFKAAQSHILETAAQSLEVERVSIWYYNEPRSAILCDDLFILSRKMHECGTILEAAHYPNYFRALEANRTIAAHEAQSDSRTADFTESYLRPLGITSMLDIPIWLHGRVVGILCHEHVAPARIWTHDEQEFANAVADMLTLALEAAERVRAENALRASEALKGAMLNSALDAIITIDHEGKVVEFNPAAETTFGYSRAEVLGRELAELLIPLDHREQHRQGFARYLATGEAKMLGARLELNALNARGEEFPIELTISRITTEGPPKFTAFLRDISQRKYMQEQLRQHTEELETLVTQRTERLQELERQRTENEKLAAAGRLAARIAHEINNPLGGIKNSFLLVKDAITPEHRYFHYVARIEKEIDRIARIVRQMFELNKPDQEQSRHFKVEETMREITTILETSRRERRVRFEWALPPTPLTVYMPEGLLRQILFNVIQNALEASPTEGKITIAATMQDHLLQIAISDQGPGIPEELRTRIFEPLFTTKTGLLNSGMGLGLSVCKNIVDALKGELTYESMLGQGTTFKISLPV